MAEETSPQHDAEPEKDAAEATPSAGSQPRWKTVLRRVGGTLAKHWFVGLITVALVGHAVGLWVFAIHRTTPVVSSSEVDLGRYEFRNASARRGELAEVQFALHVRFLDEVDGRARHQLADRRFRVEQDIEEILRQAHAADFTDPHLRELKRQLQEQINRSLELRSVADVIVTDLDLQKGDVPSSPAEAAPDQPDGDPASLPVGDGMADESEWVETPASS